MEVLQRLKHDIDVEEIRQINETVEEETDMQTSKIGAEKRKAVVIAEADNIKKLAEIKANIMAVQTRTKAQAYEA